jgi:hypothetical protein
MTSRKKINPYRPVPPFTAKVRHVQTDCKNTVKTNVSFGTCPYRHLPPKYARIRQEPPKYVIPLTCTAKMRHPIDVYRQKRHPIGGDFQTAQMSIDDFLAASGVGGEQSPLATAEGTGHF